MCVYKQALEVAAKAEMRRQTKRRQSLSRNPAAPGRGGEEGGGEGEEGGGKGVFFVEWDSVSVGNLAAAHTNHRGGVMGINR